MESYTSPKVLLLTDADVFAGTERHILDLAIGLKQENVDVRIGCPSPSILEDEAAKRSIPVEIVQKKGIFNQDAPNQLSSLLKSGEIDIIHCHNGRSWLIGALVISRAGRGKLFATQHFITPNHATQSGITKAISDLGHHWVVSKTTKIIAISEAVKEAMVDRHDASADQIQVIPNGITAPSVTPEQVETVRQELQLTETSKLIVCAARLELEKDIPSLISAMQMVHEKYPQTVCVIAGSGALKDDLTQQINDLGLSKIIHLLGFRTDVHALIAAADIFVLPSLAEPFGLVILEAMALGKPVMATDAGGPKEIVKNNETGFLVTPKSPDDLANAMLKLLSDPKISTAMGDAGKKRFHDIYTVQRMARDVLHMYNCQALNGST